MVTILQIIFKNRTCRVDLVKFWRTLLREKPIMSGKTLVRPATGREVLIATVCLLMGLISTARVNAESVLFAFTHGGKPNDAVELRSVDVTTAKPDSGMALHVD